MGKNAFDSLLESISEEDTRKALEEVTQKVPELRNGYLRQSDYSRNMDELRKEKEGLQSEVSYAKQWRDWLAENYVFDAFGEGKGGTKREIEKERELEALRRKSEELEAQISLGGEVTFDELNKHLAQMMSERKIATQDEVAKLVNEKASGAEQVISGVSHIATRLPVLAVKHFREFGDEDLNPDALLEFAGKGGYRDLGKAYDEFVAPKRQEIAAKREAEAKVRFEEEKKAEFERGKQEALKERGISSESIPIDQGEPEMTAIRKAVMGIGSKEDVPDLPFGQGHIAAYALRQKNT